MDPLPSMTRLHGYRVYGMAVASDIELGSLEACNAAASQSTVTLGTGSADFFRSIDRKSTRLNSSHVTTSRMPSSA